MAEIQFETEEFARPIQAEQSKGLTGLVHKWGIAKDERQATYILLGVAVVALAISIYLMFPRSASAPPGTLSPAEIMIQTEGI